MVQLEERERQDSRDQTASEVQLERMVRKALKEHKVNLESEVIREIEAQWESLALLDQRDQRVILGKKDHEDLEVLKDPGASKVKWVPLVSLVFRDFRADLEKLVPKDLAENKGRREELVHLVHPAHQANQDRLAASLALLQEEDDGPCLTTLKINL